jgi:hypothetical protein
MPGELFKIGTEVHAQLFDGRCGVAWITEWDGEESVATVQGFRPPSRPALSETMLIGVDRPHRVPQATIVVGPADEPAAVIAFHLPGECPWGR